MPEIKLDIRKDKNALMLVAVALTVASFLVGLLAAPLATTLGVDAMLPRTILRSVVAVVGMVLLGGASLLRPDLQKIRDSWRYARPLVLINIALAVIMGAWATFLLLFMGEFSGEQLANLLYISVLCIFVGINEEGMFRGLLFGGLLAGMGGRRGGALWAAVISSVAFGFIHVAFDINYGDFLSIAQGLLKTLETGMLGFILCVCVLEGRNIVGAMTVHSFFDWVLMVNSAISGEMPTATYVNTNQTAAFVAMGMYLLFSLFYLPKTIQSVKRLRSVPVPQYGPFVPETESAKIVVAAGHGAQGGKPQAPEDATPEHLRRERAHRVLDHKVGTIFATLLAFMATVNVISLLGLLIFNSGTGSRVVSALGTIAVSIAFLLGFQRLFAGEFDGVTGWSKTALLLALPALLLAVPNVIGWLSANFNNPLVCLVLALAPGLSEEVVFRAIPASNWMRVSGERSEIVKCVAVTSAAFALIHGINLLAGAALSSTLFQLFYAFCIGALFCAVLLRTGTILPCVIMHTIIDFTSFLTADMDNVGILSEGITINLEFWLALVAAIALLAWSAYLLRPAKQAEIVALWKGKWHKG